MTMNKPFTLIRWDRWDDETERMKYAKEINAVRKAMEEIMWESTERVTVKDERTGETIFNERGTFA
tara:strand:- start:782 stop:979 length:198 start_codon:yes stop_codon:yes gene_type:complete